MLKRSVLPSGFWIVGIHIQKVNRAVASVAVNPVVQAYWFTKNIYKCIWKMNEMKTETYFTVNTYLCRNRALLWIERRSYKYRSEPDSGRNRHRSISKKKRNIFFERKWKKNKYYSRWLSLFSREFASKKCKFTYFYTILEVFRDMKSRCLFVFPFLIMDNSSSSSFSSSLTMPFWNLIYYYICKDFFYLYKTREHYCICALSPLLFLMLLVIHIYILYIFFLLLFP